MNVDFLTIFRVLDNVTPSTYTSDFVDIDHCTGCDAPSNKPCASDCTFTIIKDMMENIKNGTVDYDKFVKLIMEIESGIEYHSVNHYIHNDCCVFCDDTYDNHASDCPSTLIYNSIDLDWNKSKSEIKSKLKSKAVRALFDVSLEAYVMVEKHKKNAEKERKASEANRKRQHEASCTCRYCGKVLSSKSGRISHEKTAKGCRVKLFAEFPDLRPHNDLVIES